MQAVLQGVWERGWAERIQSPEPPGPHRCPLFPPINSPSSHTHSLGTQGKVYKTPGKVGKPPRYIYSQHPGNTYHQVPCSGFSFEFGGLCQVVLRDPEPLAEGS